MKVPFIDLQRIYRRIEKDINSAVSELFASQRWILGPEVERLEKAFSDYIGVEGAVGVASGTDALLLSLRAQALSRYDRQFFCRDEYIITTPFTFVATAEAIIRSGATPLLVDIGEDFNISVSEIERAVSSYRNVVGILPVHLYGCPADMGAIMEIAKRYDLFVVEDCAQAFGAMISGRYAGSFGDHGAFSFFPTKILPGIGDGGMVTCGDRALCDILKALRNHGGIDKYNIEYIGYNSRLDSIQAAAIGLYLKHVKEFIRERQRVARMYIAGLSDVKDLILPKDRDTHVFNLFTLRLRGSLDRDRICQHLNNKGIGVGVYYPVLLNEMRGIKDYIVVAGDLRQAVRASKEVLSLPIFPYMKNEEVEYVVDVLRGVIRS